MAYLQPNVDKYALNGYSFFRMKQLLASPGDIFESPQGLHALALGPDSDISQVNVAYLDEQVPDTFMNQLTISPQRTFESQIVAFNQTKLYAPSQRPGRLLIWPAEIFDSTYLPPGFDEDNNGLVRETPLIDIFQFFSPPLAISSVRTDKTYYYDTLPFVGTGLLCYLMIPYYGRRYASIAIQNRSNDGEGLAGKLNVSISGVNFRISEGFTPLFNLLTLEDSIGTGSVYSQRSVMIGTGFNQITYSIDDVTSAVAAQSGKTISYQGGLFDYLLIEIAQGTEPAPAATDASVRVTVSDIVGRTGA